MSLVVNRRYQAAPTETNSSIAIYKRPVAGNALTLISQNSLNGFFGYTGSSSAALFDPRVIYDKTWQRWIVLADSFTNSAGNQFVW